MTEWRAIETAPRDGTPILVPFFFHSNSANGYVPWKSISVVIAWWDGDSWETCFMYDGACDTVGCSTPFYHRIDEAEVSFWMPLPAPPWVPPLVTPKKDETT